MGFCMALQRDYDVCDVDTVPPRRTNPLIEAPVTDLSSGFKAAVESNERKYAPVLCAFRRAGLAN